MERHVSKLKSSSLGLQLPLSYPTERKECAHHMLLCFSAHSTGSHKRACSGSNWLYCWNWVELSDKALFIRLTDMIHTDGNTIKAFAGLWHCIILHFHPKEPLGYRGVVMLLILGAPSFKSHSRPFLSQMLATLFLLQSEPNIRGPGQ